MKIGRSSDEAVARNCGRAYLIKVMGFGKLKNITIENNLRQDTREADRAGLILKPSVTGRK